MPLIRALGTFLTIVLLSSAVWAVGTTGTIVGTVTDPSGAVISGAQVTVRNVGTNATRVVQTSGTGEYSVPLLPPGVYEVTVEAANFRKSLFTGITLEVDQTARVDAKLILGAASEEVAVTGAAPLVQLDTSTLGDVVDQQKISQLPLNERNFLGFTLLVPGAQQPADGSQNSTQGGAISVNGAREQSNNFLLDGVDNNDLAINQYSVLPSVDAIEEFKVQSSNSSAEFGRSGGAQINVVTKSGTNSFHGTAFEFVRNRHLDAKNYFDLPNCTAGAAAGSCADIPRFDRSQFGGTLGGPIVKNKTFFFGSYEGLHLRQATTRQATVPNQTQRNTALTEALTQVSTPNLAGVAVLNLIPLPNTGADLSTSNSFTSAPVISNTVNQVLGKVDHRINERNTLSGEYSLFNENRFNPFDPLASFTNLPGYGSFTKNRGQLVRITWTSTINTHLVNEARFGFNRLRGGIFQQHSGTDFASSIGFPVVLNNPVDLGVPAVSLGGAFDSIGEPTNLPQDRRDNTFHYADTLAWNPALNGGRHQFKFGADIRRFQLNFYLDAVARGLWFFTGNPGFTVPNNDPLAQVLMGTPDFTVAVQGNTFTNLRSTELDFFGQDDIRVTSRLTLNAGLRWEYNSPPVDTKNRLTVPDLTSNALTCSPQPNCQFIQAGTNGVPRATYGSTKTNFAPRLGFAWRPLATDRMVVRASYGIFYDVGILNGNILPRFNPPFFNQILYPGSNSLTVQNILNQTAAVLPALPSMIDPRYRDGYMQQWNLDVQNEVVKNLVVDFAYVGSKGTHLINQLDSDQASVPGGPLPFPAYGGITQVQSEATSNYNSFQFRAEKRTTHGLTFLTAYTFSRSLDDASALFTTLGDTNFPQNSHNLNAERGLSDFDARHRFVTSYVYQLPLGKGQRWASSGGVPSALLGGWELSGILAVQSGRPFTVVRGIDQSHTGSIATFGSSVDRPNVLFNPSQTGGTPQVPGEVCATSVRRPGSWYNPCAFDLTTTTTGYFGDESRNSLIGPTLRDFDYSVLKNIPLGETRQFQFRAEMFNIVNHPNFDLPVNVIDSVTTAGQIQSSNKYGNKPPRQIQLGLKFIF